MNDHVDRFLTRWFGWMPAGRRLRRVMELERQIDELDRELERMAAARR